MTDFATEMASTSRNWPMDAFKYPDRPAVSFLSNLVFNTPALDTVDGSYPVETQ